MSIIHNISEKFTNIPKDKEAFPIQSLSGELILNIFTHLSIKDLFETSLVCKQFFKLTSTCYLWSQLILRDKLLEEPSLKKLKTNKITSKNIYDLLTIKSTPEERKLYSKYDFMRRRFTILITKGNRYYTTLHSIEINKQWCMKCMTIIGNNGRGILPHTFAIRIEKLTYSHKTARKSLSWKAPCLLPQTIIAGFTPPLVKLELTDKHGLALLSTGTIILWDLLFLNKIFTFEYYKGHMTAAAIDNENIFISTYGGKIERIGIDSLYAIKQIYKKNEENIKLLEATKLFYKENKEDFNFLEKSHSHLFAASKSKVLGWILEKNNLTSEPSLSSPTAEIDLPKVSFLYPKRSTKEATTKLFVGDEEGCLKCYKFSSNTHQLMFSIPITDQPILKIKFAQPFLYVLSSEKKNSDVTYKVFMLFKTKLVATLENKEKILNFSIEKSHIVLYGQNGNIIFRDIRSFVRALSTSSNSPSVN